MTKYSMRFDDLTKRPVKPQRPLTYTENLQAKLLAELCEAEASDTDLRARWGDFDPEDRAMLPQTKVGGAPAPTLWSAYAVVQNILGKNRVTNDEDALTPNMYYVYQSNNEPMFRDTDNGVGSINLPDLSSTAARDVAVAAHEAFHAYVHSKSQGGVVHANEKIINNLAEKWLRKHLSGTALHAAIEKITGSRISYGSNHMPNVKEEIKLGRSVRYPFYSIFSAVTQRDGKPGLSIGLRKDRPAEVKKSGIYVWHHPDWGYFYVGIAAADNFTERWNKHIQKLLDQCTSAKQMRNWKEFATKFKNAGYGIDDLKDVTLRFFPITSVADYGGDRAQLKKELEALETRIVSMINPACNREYKPTLPSATKFPQQRPQPQQTDIEEPKV
jgi:hypothetical protein